MAEEERNVEHPRIQNIFTLGNLLTSGAIIVSIALAFGSLRSETTALSIRVDKGESRDDETGKTLSQVKETIVDIKADQRAQGRQLDRIESLLRAGKGNP